MPPEENNTSLQRAALTMAWLSAFSTPLMLSAVNVALPSIARDLDMHAVLLGWVPLAYLLASAMFVLVFGRLGDMIGRKRVFLIGTWGVMLSSIAAAASPSGEMLLAMRFVQGMFTAALYASQMAIVSSVFPPHRRGHAIGLTISSVYVGLTVGPALGGWLQEVFGWRACLLVQVPFSIVVLGLAAWRVRGEWAGAERGRFDVPGASLYMFVLLAITGGASLLPAPPGWLLIVLGTAAAIGFIRYEQRTEHPIFDTQLFFSNRVFGLSCLAAFLIYTATYANVVLVALYLQYLHAMPPGRAGIVMMAQPLTMALFSPFMGRLSDRIEPRWLASAGMAITIVGLVVLATLTVHSPLTLLVGALVATGFGFSLFSAPNANAIMSAVDRSQYGSATGKVATMRLLGQMCSMGIITVVFALVLGPVTITPAVYASLNDALRTSYLVAAALCVPGVLFSLARGRMHAPANDAGSASASKLGTSPKAQGTANNSAVNRLR